MASEEQLPQSVREALDRMREDKAREREAEIRRRRAEEGLYPQRGIEAAFMTDADLAALQQAQMNQQCQKSGYMRPLGDAPRQMAAPSDWRQGPSDLGSRANIEATFRLECLKMAVELYKPVDPGNPDYVTSPPLIIAAAEAFFVFIMSQKVEQGFE
jgi:hypothetical protein